ncbi:MAG: ABC transporter permease [Spirochaetes bacterium]|nr:ABC transporter permease [Spirochaetota bacterium]
MTSATIRKIMLAPVLRIVDQAGGILGLLIYSLAEAVQLGKPDTDVVYEETVKQVYFSGVTTVPLIAVMSLALGIGINLSASAASNFLSAEMVSNLIITVILREGGPLLTAIILISRSGTAISAEIGAIVIGHELEALESLGVDPLRLITLPRIIGMMISMMVLNLLFTAIGIFGGLIVSAMLNPAVSFLSFVDTFFTYLTYADLFINVLKSLILGALVSVTSVYYGFKIRGATSAIAIAAQKGVMSGFLWVFIFDIIISVLFYVSGGGK